MIIVCISDTHEFHSTLHIPKADLLIHAGDITFRGDPLKVQEFNEWCSGVLKEARVESIVSIAGNHDFLFEDNPVLARSFLTASLYLQDSSCRIQGLNIYGTPWQPWFFDWAFNLRTEEQLKEKFDGIPEGTDILVCHTPPFGILDRNSYGAHCGSRALLDAVYRVKPKLVVFGHIHEGYGMIRKDGITFINASICTAEYNPTNPPIVLDLGGASPPAKAR